MYIVYSTYISSCQAGVQVSDVIVPVAANVTLATWSPISEYIDQ
jgi:hypothetical protein